MIICLVGLFGAAVFGTALPDVAKGLLATHWPASTTPMNQVAPKAPPSELPPLSQGESWPPDGSRNASPLAHVSQPAPTAFTAAGVLQAVPEVSDGGEADWQSASGGRPLVASPNSDGRTDTVQASYESWAGQPPENLAASHEVYPARVTPLSAAQATPDMFSSDRLSPVTPRPQPGRTADQFTHIQTRLRELGATYYRLESWGGDGQYFRFHCRMAVGDSPGYARQFEATESDGLRAMARVLEEVEYWRGLR